MTEEKKGVKRTEVGLIPEDWVIVKLGDLSDITSSKRIMKSEYQKSGVPFYRSKEIIDKSRNTYEGSEIHIPTGRYESLKRNYGAPVDGEILVSAVGTLGVTYLIKESDLPFYFKDGNLIWLRKISDKVEPNFLTFYFNSSRFEKEIDKTTAGSSQRALTIVKLKNFNIPLPPTLEEQQAIASALSDVDELIRSLDGLIQKKQAIKKGAMQQLLTGKKRLPGFDGGWAEVKSGEVVEYINGRAYSKHEWENTGTPVVRLQNLTGSGESYYYSNLNLPEKNYMYEGDLIFMWSASFGPYIWKGPKAIYHYHIWKIDCNADKIDKMFYYHKLVRLTEELKQTTSGSTMLHLTKAGMEKFKLNLPPLEEQKAIAQILSDMDRELQTLRQKREKYVQIKQGMMQELLTGRTRLVKKEATIHQMPRKRNQNYEDAVLLSTIIHRYGSESFKLNRFRYQKYVYLLKRFLQANTVDYMKKAAGPYNPKMRYRGGESVAIKEGYIEEIEHNGYDCFTTGNKVEVALEYFQKWYGEAPLQWLDQFQYSKSGELELLTTVDMAMQEILKEGHKSDVQSVVEFIKTTPKWKKKLEKPEFTDSGIEQGIQKLEELFVT